MEPRQTSDNEKENISISYNRNLKEYSCFIGVKTLESENLNAQLLELFLPEGILDHFIVTDFTQKSSGQDLYTKSLTIYLEEKKEIPQEYSHYKYKASGFMPPKLIQDCPVRSSLVSLSIKRRRWDVEIDGKIEKKSRDWQTVAKGTKLNPEYASFLKEIGGL